MLTILSFETDTIFNNPLLLSSFTLLKVLIEKSKTVQV